MGIFNKKYLLEIERLKLEVGELRKSNCELKACINPPSELNQLGIHNLKALYKTERALFTTGEVRVFEWLLSIFNDCEFIKRTGNRFFLFPKVRIADFTELWYNELGSYKKSSYNVDGTIRYSKNVQILHKIGEISKDEKIQSELYKKIALYPILNKHVDFLICEKALDKNGGANYLAKMIVEAHGEEHDSISKKKNYKSVESDNFKESYFDKSDGIENATGVKIESMIIKYTDFDKPDVITAKGQDLVDKLVR